MYAPLLTECVFSISQKIEEVGSVSCDSGGQRGLSTGVTMRLQFLFVLLLSLSLSACLSTRDERGDDDDSADDDDASGDDDDSVDPPRGPPPGATDFGPDVGQILPEVTIQWSNGDVGSLYELCGAVTLLQLDAMWNAAAGPAANEVEAIYQAFGPEGMTAATILFENSDSTTPTANDLTLWAKEFGLSFPVVGTPNTKEFQSLVSSGGIGLPYFIVVDRDMRVLRAAVETIDEAVQLIEETLQGS
jgi:hypothetical protein